MKRFGLAAGILLLATGQAASAQSSFSFSRGGTTGGGTVTTTTTTTVTPPTITVTPVTPVDPTPVIQPPRIISIPQVPDRPFINPLPNPMDVTRTFSTPNQVIPNFLAGPDPVLGLSETKFPSQDKLKGSTDFILVQGPEGSFQRETPYLVHLVTGTVLVSVKRPSSMGMLDTPYGELAFGANSDAFVQLDNGVLRIRNMDGLGPTVRVRLDKGPFVTNSKTYSVAPGYELVVSDHKLTREDLRPQDGILRRRSQVIDNGFGGISQFHVETALQHSALVTSMTQQATDAKNKRVLNDMSRMAAVLNHVEGVDGYTNQQ